MKVKALLGAIVFLASFSAYAVENPGTGDSSILFTAFDSTSGASIVVDTGLNYSDLIVRGTETGPGGGTEAVNTFMDQTISYSMDINTLLANNGIDTLVENYETTFGSIIPEWNLVAGDATSLGGTNGLGQSLLSTFEVVGAGALNPAVSTTGITQLNTFFAELGSDTANISLDPTDTPNASNGNAGNNFGGVTSLGDNTNLADGSTVGLVVYATQLFNTGGFGIESAGQAVDVFLSEITASFDGTTLTISGGTTVIPVPAAVWLFGSAIAGLIGFGRRRSVSA